MNEITLSKLATIIIFLLVYCLPMSVVGMGNEKEKSSSTENKPHCRGCSNGGSLSAENTVRENNEHLTNTNTEDNSNTSTWLMRRPGGVRSNAEQINRDNENDEKVDTSPFTHWRERAHSFILVSELDAIVIGIESRGKKYSIVLTLADNNTQLRITFLPCDSIPTPSIEESWLDVQDAIPIIRDVLRNPASDSSDGNSQHIIAQLALPFNQEVSEASSNDISNSVNNPWLMTPTVEVYSTAHTNHGPIGRSIGDNERIRPILNFLSRDISTTQIATIEGLISSVYAGGPCPSSVSVPNGAGEPLVGTWIHRPQPQSYGAYFMSIVEYARYGVFGHNNYRLIGAVTFTTMCIALRINQYLSENNGPPVEVYTGSSGLR